DSSSSARRLRRFATARPRGVVAPVRDGATGRPARVPPVLVDRLDLTPEEFAAGTGWHVEPSGACKGDVCVPLPGDRFDAVSAAERLGMAVVREPAAGLWSFGPESLGGRALVSAESPELVLPDLDGNEFRLTSLRGQKVVLVAWAPY